MARPQRPFSLTAGQRETLSRLAQDPKLSKPCARRAHIVLLAAKGWETQRIAKKLRVSPDMVRRWCQRVLDKGVDALDDAPRSGRPRSASDQKVESACDFTQPLPRGRSRWSCRRMARRTGLSRSTVQRIWARQGIQPHLAPAVGQTSERRFWDMIGVYLSPPIEALVLCVARDGEPVEPASRLGSSTSLPTRGGSVRLFAALNYLRSKLRSGPLVRSAPRQWMEYLQTIKAKLLPEMTVHLVVGNQTCQPNRKLDRWLAKHRCFEWHVAPKNLPWCMQVEQFFQRLPADSVLPGSFASGAEIGQAIWDHLEQNPLRPPPFLWRAEETSVYEKWCSARDAVKPKPQV